MDNIVIVSNRNWNRNLENDLSERFENYHFIFISEPEQFTASFLAHSHPVKVFIPHWSFIIPEEIYSHFECIVFHMTDLPYGRGGSPLQNLILRGLTETKISALRVEKELDAGPVYLKRDLPLWGTAEEIYIRANRIICEMIGDIICNNPLPIRQEGEVVIFKRRKPTQSNMAEVQHTDQLYDMIRMLDAEGYPHAFIENDSFRFEFTRASLKADGSICADVKILKK